MREIPLGRSNLVALVDEEDYERIAAHKWHTRVDRRAIRWADGANSRRVLMHREVVSAPDGVIVDHANGDTLDNRRSNLRICTAAQNAWNVRAVRGKRFKGVQRYEPNRWRARIRINGHLTHIGSFGSEVEAALAYDVIARQLFGEFACLNFPRDGERAASAA